jgi:hypothetical protein
MFTRRINTASCPSARRTGPCSRSNTQKDANTYDGGGGELSLIRDAVFAFGCPVGDFDVPPGPVLKEMLEIEPFLGWWTGRVCSALTCSIMGSSRAGGKKLSVPVRVSGEMGEFGDSDGGEFNGDDDDDMVPRFRDFGTRIHWISSFSSLGKLLRIQVGERKSSVVGYCRAIPGRKDLGFFQIFSRGRSSGRTRHTAVLSHHTVYS